MAAQDRKHEGSQDDTSADGGVSDSSAGVKRQAGQRHSWGSKGAASRPAAAQGDPARESQEHGGDREERGDTRGKPLRGSSAGSAAGSANRFAGSLQPSRR